MTQTKQATLERIRARLVRTDGAIARIDAGTRDADPDVRRRWAESAHECARIQDTARARLRALESAPDDDWEQEAASAEGAWRALERAASEAAASILGHGALDADAPRRASDEDPRT